MKDKIIRLIEENKISSAETSDVLGKKGALKGIFPVNRKHFSVGEVVFIYAYNESNWELHEQLSEINCENKIVYVHCIQCGERAVLGDLVAKYLFLYKRCKALVVDGFVRDVHRLIKENYPVWCAGITPIGCFNIKNETVPEAGELNALRKKFDKGIMVCDDSGVILIEEEFISEKMIGQLNYIELQEDIWYFCLDTHKMSTYDVVCLKKYLNVEGLVDKEKLLQLARHSTNQ
jgi:4-hydroxy-4-methyl-2-oxoglutarate aldolase